VWVRLARRRAKRDTEAGRLCLASGDLHGASAYFHKAALTAPREWEPCYWEGCTAAHLGNYAAAYAHFTAALELDRNIGRIYVQRGYVGIRRGDQEGALHDLRAAAGLGALDDLGQLALGALELGAGSWEPARQALSRSRRADLARYREALLGLATERAGDAGAAVAAYSAAISYGNAAGPVLFRHAMAAFRSGTVLAGHASWSALRERYPEWKVPARGAAACEVLLAGERLRAGDADDAARALRAAAAQLDGAPWLASNLAVAEYLNGSIAQAARLWDGVLSLRPGDARVRTAAAICQAKLGAADAACEAFTALAVTAPGWPPVPAVQVIAAPAAERPAWRNVAARARLASLTAAEAEDWARSGALAGLARSLRPGPSRADLLEALVLLRSGNRDSAIELLAESSRTRPADARLLHMRSVVLLHTLRAPAGEPAAEPLWRQCVSAWAALLADEAFWSAWQARAEQRYQAPVDASAVAQVRGGVRALMEKTLPDDTARLLFRREVEAARVLRELGGFPLPGGAGESVNAGPVRIAEMGLHDEFGVFAAQADRSALSRPASSATLLRTFSALGVAYCLLLDGRAAQAAAAAADLRCADCRGRAATAEPMVCAPGCPRFAVENPAAARPDGRARLAAEARSVLLEALRESALAALAAPEPDITTIAGYWRRSLALTAADQRAPVERTVSDQALGRADTLAAADKKDMAIDLLDGACQVIGAPGGGRVGGRLAVLLNNRGVGRVDTDPVSARADLRRATLLNPHERPLWMNRVDAEAAGLVAELERSDRADAIRRVQALEQAVSEALRYFPGDPEFVSLGRSMLSVRAKIELEAFAAAVDRGDRAAARGRLLAAAEIARAGLARYPRDPEFTELTRTLAPLLAQVGRRG
jgi:tetratricopeptide (TPR) repeat protein